MDGKLISIESLKAFANWPCKAKFRFVDSNRFVEFSEIQNSPEMMTNSDVRYKMSIIEEFHIEKNSGHIKVELKTDKEEALSWPERAQQIFYMMILQTLKLIETEFTRGNLPMPLTEIVLFNGLDQEIRTCSKIEIENTLGEIEQLADSL